MQKENLTVPFILVTGFLGSGKTTFLKRLLHNIPEDLNIAVIQNEFAPSNVDGEELMQSTGGAFELLEINNGSVFCVCLLGTFVHSLSEFMDVHHPDMVIMEASGLSDPAGIAELFQSDILSKKVFFKEAWCIVDAAHFGKIERMNVRYRHQVQVADRVIVNKTDRVSTEMTNSVESRVRELNPFCQIMKSTYCEVDTDLLSKEAEKSNPELSKRIEAEKSEGRPAMMSGVIKLGMKVEPEALKDLLTDYANGLIRAKGFFCDSSNQGYALHYVHGDVQWEKLEDYSGKLHLILMGTEINLPELTKKLKSLA